MKLDALLRRSKLATIACCFITVLPIIGRTQDISDQDDRGGSSLQASAQVGGSYTDNFYYGSNSSRGAVGLAFKPRLTYGYGLSRFKFLAQGDADFAAFDTPNSQDNYIDGSGRLGAEWQSALRHRFAFGSGVRFGHDPFGTERTAGVPASLSRDIDLWRTVSTNLNYFYGVPTDTFGLELQTSADNKQYTSNETTTQFLDYSSVLGGATILYNYSPKTALLLDVHAAKTNFNQIAFFDLGTTDIHYLVGARWLATSKTSGDVRVGWLTRRSNDSRLGQIGALDWQANIRWNPLSNRTFLLRTGFANQPTYLLNAVSISNRSVALDWTEDWNSRLTTIATVNYVRATFEGANRSDNIYSGLVGAEYRMREHISLLGNLGYATKDSNVVGTDYNRFSSYLGLKFRN